MGEAVTCKFRAIDYRSVVFVALVLTEPEVKNCFSVITQVIITERKEKPTVQIVIIVGFIQCNVLVRI